MNTVCVGHILEMIFGKVACLEGKRVDGTPFKLSTDELDDALSKIPAKAALWDGTTGIRMENSAFLGLVFYQRVRSLELFVSHFSTSYILRTSFDSIKDVRVA
jgi:DNA-directed RNA polymerase beta subunit